MLTRQPRAPTEAFEILLTHAQCEFTVRHWRESVSLPVVATTSSPRS